MSENNRGSHVLERKLLSMFNTLWGFVSPVDILVSWKYGISLESCNVAFFVPSMEFLSDVLGLIFYNCSQGSLYSLNNNNKLLTE